MKCPECGEELSTNPNYCSECDWDMDDEGEDDLTVDELEDIEDDEC